MKSVSWKDIAELLGMAAIVASLIFVGMQLRQERDIVRRESRTDFVASTVEIGRLFSDNRSVWLKGLSGNSLTEEDQVTVNAPTASLLHRLLLIEPLKMECPNVLFDVRPILHTGRSISLTSKIYTYPIFAASLTLISQQGGLIKKREMTGSFLAPSQFYQLNG